MRRLGTIIVLMGLVMGLGARSAQAQAQSGQQQNGQDRLQSTLETCFSCHGTGGVSVIPSRPTIAGQKPQYIARQLHAFQRAKVAHDADNDADNPAAGQAQALPMRSDPVMEHMTAGLDNALIDQVAERIAALPCDGDKAKAAKNPPAKPLIAGRCDVCHGANGIGTQPQIPNLAGQQGAYLRRQLLLMRETAYGAEPREGERWRRHPIMERQAARISIADVDALARYYSGLDCRGAAASEKR